MRLKEPRILPVRKVFQILKDMLMSGQLAELQKPSLKVSQVDGLAVLGQEVSYVFLVNGPAGHQLVDDNVLAGSESDRAVIQQYVVRAFDCLCLVGSEREDEIHSDFGFWVFCRKHLGLDSEGMWVLCQRFQTQLPARFLNTGELLRIHSAISMSRVKRGRP
jgi:hypothetical protein